MSALALLENEVEVRVNHGQSVGAIERDVILRAEELTEDERSSLWHYAQSLRRARSRVLAQASGVERAYLRSLLQYEG